jgi:helix-turn-helix protein
MTGTVRREHHALVDYAQAQQAFLTPVAPERPAAGLPDTPGRRLRDAAEPIATISWWGRPVNDRLAALGLDFLTGYVWGRAAPMGEPAPMVVVAAFGVFEPGMVTGLYEQARATADRTAVLAAREQGVVEALRELLPDADVTGAVDLLRRGTDAAAAHVAGRPLFAGQLSLPWPADPLGRLWHAATLLREYRGDAHQAANVAAGLTAVQMNLLTEYWVGWEHGAYAGTRGWSPEAMAEADTGLARRGLVADGRLTAGGRALRDDVEARTEAAMEPVLAAIGPDLPDLTRQLDAWSAAVVAGGAAPPDVYKRISG